MRACSTPRLSVCAVVVMAIWSVLGLVFLFLFHSATVDSRSWRQYASSSPHSSKCPWLPSCREQLPEVTSDIGLPKFTPNAALPESQQITERSAWLRSLAVNRERLQHLRKTCDLQGSEYYYGNRYENMRFFLVDKTHKFLQCFIPKVGCSTMKRIFALLERRIDEQALFNISSRKIHHMYNAVSVLSDKEYRRFHIMHHLVNTFTKAMFVRDPYARLFSAYIDRMFSVSETLRIVDHWEVLQSENRTGCARAKIAFRHVIDHVINTPPQQLDMHLSPYDQICFPCHMSYDYVGKMETLQSDLANVLTSLGVDIGEVTGPMNKQFDVTNELSIVRDVSARAFEMMNEENLRCFTKHSILERTWVTFQVRGYLSINDPFPLKSQQEEEKVTMEQFQRMTREAYLRVQDRSAVHHQRSQAMREAYYSVPRPLLHKLQALLQRDCDLFHYDCSVDRRFPESQRPALLFKFNPV